jgi:hypothetical protein
MLFFSVHRTAILIMAAGLTAFGQPPAKDAPAEAKGLPPRASAADYQVHAQAGAVTLAAEFAGHAVPTAQGPLSSEDYITVEVAVFGAAGAQARLAAGDFSLRVNGKKQPLPSAPYGLVVGSLKDPEYVPPDPPAAGPKSKTSMSGGGGGGDGRQPGEPPPPPPPIPFPIRRAMAQRVQKAALPEGDRPLPQAGLIFFQYRGKTEGIRSLELLYEGAAGKATLNLQP